MVEVGLAQEWLSYMRDAKRQNLSCLQFQSFRSILLQIWTQLVLEELMAYLFFHVDTYSTAPNGHQNVS
jgi:hypothetical protein